MSHATGVLASGSGVRRMNALDILRESIRILRADPSSFMTIFAALLFPVSAALLLAGRCRPPLPKPRNPRRRLGSPPRPPPRSACPSHLRHPRYRRRLFPSPRFPSPPRPRRNGIFSCVLLCRKKGRPRTARLRPPPCVASPALDLPLRVRRRFRLLGPLHRHPPTRLQLARRAGLPTRHRRLPGAADVHGLLRGVRAHHHRLQPRERDRGAGGCVWGTGADEVGGLTRGQMQGGLLIFLGSAIGMACVDGLFEHRVKTLSYGDGSSRLWEGPLLILMYSFILLVDSMMSAVFYFTCRSSSIQLLMDVDVDDDEESLKQTANFPEGSREME